MFLVIGVAVFWFGCYDVRVLNVSNYAISRCIKLKLGLLLSLIYSLQKVLPQLWTACNPIGEHCSATRYAGACLYRPVYPRPNNALD